MAPLTVDADLTQYYYFRNSSISEGKEKIMCMVKTAFSHVSRVRKLRLKLRPADFPDVLALLASPAPLLEHCDIIFASADQEALPNLFNGICPRLTSLSTDRCILNWQAPIFSNLQNLKIDSAGLVPMCQFLTALSSMSYLKSLEMSVTSISNSDDHLVHVELPHLVKLWLRADFAGWMRLLEHIDAPNTTCLQLHNNSRDHIDQTQQVALAHRLVNQISKYMLEPIRSMTIDGMGLKMWVASSSENPRFDISVPYEAREQISKVILPALSYRELNSVTIGASLDAETWLNCFADLENLKEIEVHEGPGFLSALESGIPKRATKNCEALKFKAMNRLTIQGWNLTECAPNQENGSHMKRLKTFLRARGKYAEPLDELVVQRCRCLPNREVETLRKIVKVLDYDPTKNYRR
ncbi:hypothetical protein H0H81_001693 [Sphagnurus paluster]|uniref:Uncharacterized protein n=1 Tax=Sphagnurus paluster TaxID=117069 RepID=A0A9P7KHX9_9AGAR|nr:hypothetical protein H0H81_001693 [Sphagnurus paluster]